MAPFVKTPEFKKLNVGFGLDEAGACPTDSFLLFNAERALWRKKMLLDLILKICWHITWKLKCM